MPSAEGPIFSKYTDKGAYHWRDVSHSLRGHNAFTHARYVRALRVLAPQRGQRILDVGCGDGALSAMIARSGAHVFGMDYVLQGLGFAAEHTRTLPAWFVAASADALPVHSGSLDAVVATEIIEHLARPDDLLAELHRVLRVGGRIVVTTPHRLTEEPIDPEHVSEFFPEELAKHLRRFFAQVAVQPSHPLWLSELYVQEFGQRRWLRLVINMLSLYARRNPFLSDRRYRYYAQLVATGVKP